MPFKISIIDQFGENVLHKGRNGAGVKAELFFIRFDKMFGKHHVSDTKRGRDRFGKGIQIYDVIVVLAVDAKPSALRKLTTYPLRSLDST